MEKNKKNLIVLLVLIVLLISMFFLFGNSKKGVNVNNQNENLNLMSNIQEVEGLKVTVVNQGVGDKMAENGNTVSVNYTGKLIDGTVFDSNTDPAFNHVTPFTFRLGEGQVIRGWDLGIWGMKEGEMRMLEISPELAYGNMSVGELIPANSTLIFEVELLSIN